MVGHDDALGRAGLLLGQERHALPTKMSCLSGMDTLRCNTLSTLRTTCSLAGSIKHPFSQHIPCENTVLKLCDLGLQVGQRIHFSPLLREWSVKG
jgi:hypothetical protein